MADDRPTREDEPLEIGGLVLKAGVSIGGYVFLREIGSGGMARILLAKDPAGNLVALKVLRRSRIKSGLERFRREFRALSRIHHPNVIRVSAYGDLHGHPFIAMEYVDGYDLHSLIRNFKTWKPEERWQRVQEILIDLCRALSAIHRRGLVHRDLKPSNVLIDKETHTSKLTDFGIVKDLDPSSDPMKSATLVGTWAYASPEQITGSAIDHRSDLYSLGVILFAMLTQKRPFVASDMAGYLTMHRDRPAPAPRDIHRDVPEHLDEICRRLLQKAPRDRYQSAQEILYRLEAERREPTPTEVLGWEPPLVGRSLEIEAIDNAVAALVARRGGLLVLQGEAGAGKTRLLGVAEDRVRDLELPHVRGVFRAEDPPFTVFTEIVRRALGDLGARAPAHLVADFQKLSPSEVPSARALYDVSRDILAHALEDGPRVLLLDDLHFAHAKELNLLTMLLHTLVTGEQHALLVIGAVRPKANAAADALAAGEGLGFEPQEVEVGPLSREDVAKMVQQLVGDSHQARILAVRLHKETMGNGSFLTEFLRAFIANGWIRQDSEGVYHLVMNDEELAAGHLEIPQPIRQRMKAHLDGVSTGDRRILEALSVSGRETDGEILLDVLDETEESLGEGLGRLLAAGIVRERRAGDSVLHEVTHPKFAEVVYRDLDPERRSRLHRKVAAALELHFANDPRVLEVVGEHYLQSGDVGRAYRYLVAAARRHLDRSLLKEAWDLSEKACTLEDAAQADASSAGGFEQRAYQRDLLAVRAAVLYNRAEWVDAEAAYRRILELAEEDGDPKNACEARLKLATVLRRRGKHDESRTFAELALESSRRLHYREGVAEALHGMSALAWTEGRIEECERLASEGLLVAQGTAMRERRADLLIAASLAQATRGHIAAATNGLTEAEEIYRDLRLKQQRCLALANLAELLVWQGEPLQARQRAHVALDLARELDYKIGLCSATRTMSLAALDLGLYDEAESGMRYALMVSREIDLPEEILQCLVGLTQLELERGQLAEARQQGARAVEVVLRRDPERYLPMLQVLLARADARNDAASAKVLIAKAEDALDELPLPRRTLVQLALAWALYAVNDREGALRCARTVLSAAGARGFRLVSLEARALLAQLTDPEEQKIHRAVGQDLARDFVQTLSPELARSFKRRPFLAFLEEEPAVRPALDPIG